MKKISMTAFLIVFLTTIAFAAEHRTLPAKKPTEKDKCPVCGMYVAKYSDWTAQVAFEDGTYYFFDGVKDMLKFYQNIAKYAPKRKAADIKAIYVKDYYNVKFIDATKAFYVIGSDVMGPMGKELIPFEKKDDANTFLKDHKGERILQFKEITPEIVKKLQ